MIYGRGYEKTSFENIYVKKGKLSFIKNKLKGINVIIFDLDGTIYPNLFILDVVKSIFKKKLKSNPLKYKKN